MGGVEAQTNRISSTITWIIKNYKMNVWKVGGHCLRGGELGCLVALLGGVVFKCPWEVGLSGFYP